MQHCFVTARINYHTNASTACEILVKICAVISQFKKGKLEKLPRLGCNLTIIVHLARWRFEKYWNIKILISAGQSAIISHFCTSYEDLVRFGLVTPEF